MPSAGAAVANLSGARGNFGQHNSAPRAQGAIAPERAGTERASRGGVSLAWLHTNSEGPHRGASLLGRSRRSLAAQRAGASKRRAAAHPSGNKKSLTQ